MKDLGDDVVTTFAFRASTNAKCRTSRRLLFVCLRSATNLRELPGHGGEIVVRQQQQKGEESIHNAPRHPAPDRRHRYYCVRGLLRLGDARAAILLAHGVRPTRPCSRRQQRVKLDQPRRRLWTWSTGEPVASAPPAEQGLDMEQGDAGAAANRTDVSIKPKVLPKRRDLRRGRSDRPSAAAAAASPRGCVQRARPSSRRRPRRRSCTARNSVTTAFFWANQPRPPPPLRRTSARDGWAPERTQPLRSHADLAVALARRAVRLHRFPRAQSSS